MYKFVSSVDAVFGWVGWWLAEGGCDGVVGSSPRETHMVDFCFMATFLERSEVKSNQCETSKEHNFRITRATNSTSRKFAWFQVLVSDPVDITLFLPRLSVIHLQDSLLESLLKIVSSIQQQLSQKTVVKWMGVVFHHLQ